MTVGPAMVGSSVGGSVTEAVDSPIMATEGLEMEMEMVDGSHWGQRGCYPGGKLRVY